MPSSCHRQSGPWASERLPELAFQAHQNMPLTALCSPSAAAPWLLHQSANSLCGTSSLDSCAHATRLNHAQKGSWGDRCLRAVAREEQPRKAAAATQRAPTHLEAGACLADEDREEVA